MAGVRWRGGEMTRMTVAEEKDIAKGICLTGGTSANELVELSFRDGRVWSVVDLDIDDATGSVLEKIMTSLSSGSLP
jgi:hypothetical protein